MTKEQRSHRAIFGETLRAEALLAGFFVAPRAQIHEGSARSSLREPCQNGSQQQYPEFFNRLLGIAHGQPEHEENHRPLPGISADIAGRGERAGGKPAAGAGGEIPGGAGFR